MARGDATFIFDNPFVLYNARHVVKIEMGVPEFSSDTDEIQKRIIGFTTPR